MSIATAASATPAPASIAEENIKHNRGFWARYDWPQAGDEWSAPLGGTRTMWEAVIRPRISAFIPAGSILEIAPGHGRCTQFLLDACERLTIVDLVPECIEACKRRFGSRPGLTCAVNDGSTLPMVDDESIDFAFTWDSLVHVERETVASYVRELTRVLVPGGFAFIHHSNLGAYTDKFRQFDWARDFHARGKTMSAACMRADCEAAGLHCVSQELIPWGSTGFFIDTFSLIHKPATIAPHAPTIVEENTHWGIETAIARRIGRLYNPAV